MVLPTHPIVQGSHLMFGWSEDQYKSPLWGNGQVLAWGDDPEQRPLLLAAEYGAGRGAAAAVPLFNPAFLKWPRQQNADRQRDPVVARGQAAVGHVAAGTTEPAIYGVGVPWIVEDSLGRMGLRVTGQAAGAAGAVVYDVPSAEQAQAVAALAKAGKPVVVANPDAFASRAAEVLGDAGACRSARTRLDPRARRPRRYWLTSRWEAKAEIKWCCLGRRRRQRRQGPGLVHAPGGGAGQVDGRFARSKLSRRPEDRLPAADQPMSRRLSWSKTYRWRLEGNLLDRRDFVEGWERPDYDDSAWAQRSFGQEPPSPKLLGQQTPGQSLLAGAVWARAKLTLANPQTSRRWLVPSERPEVVTLLDGKPLAAKGGAAHALGGRAPGRPAGLAVARDWSAAIMTPGAKARRSWQWPSIAAEPGSAQAAPSLKGKIWYKANVHLAAGSRWNAIQIEHRAEPSAGVLYVNGKRISGSASGLLLVPWHAGDNLVVWGNLD